MKFLRRLLIVLAGLAVMVLDVGLMLPDRVHMERSIEIAAPPATVYGLVNNFREFNKWSPWYGLDPEARYSYEGPESGVGSRMSWQSDKAEVGSGSQEILEAEPNSRVRTVLDFGEQGTAYATLAIEPINGGSRVTWGLDSEFGYDIAGRYFGLLFDRVVGPDYETGLASLKRLAESEKGSGSPGG